MRTSSTPFKAAALLLCLSLAFSGCTRLKPDQYTEFGYKGQAEVKEGKKVLVIDWIGNIFGALSKLILWHWKIERHSIREDTEASLEEYIAQNQDVLGNVMVQKNRYAPQDAWRRLFKNKGVKWPYRYFIGIFVVLIVDTLLPGRIFGGDHYNPFTHTVNLYSDLPAVALHELGHARDFSERRYRGSYALLYAVPFFNLYHESRATKHAFEHVRTHKQVDLEIQCYKILYPAYGTYVGSYIPYGTIVGAIVGHIWGRVEARQLQNEIDEAKARQADPNRRVV
jgi:hypothetical protein